MTERDLFVKNIPLIAEMVVECRKMTKKEFIDAKKNILAEASEAAKPFMRKIFVVIESQLQGT